MQTIKKIFSVFFFIICVFKLYGTSRSEDSLRFEVLLTSGLIDELHTGNRFINSIDITDNQLILLSTKDQFYLLGWGGIKPTGKKIAGNIGSFAYTPDRLLMTVRNNELCVFDSTGNLSRLYTLPASDMGISSGKYAMYIFDRNGAKGKQAVYVITHGGKYSKLFEVPKPIYSVVEWDTLIFFSNGNTIFQYNLESKDMRALASLPDNKTVRSLAVDPSNGRIFFSTDNMVFSFKNSEKVVITDKIGGKLFFYDGLIIFSPENKLLVRLVGLDDAIDTKTNAITVVKEVRPAIEIITNAIIIGLVGDNLSDGIIINIINHSKVNFNLSVDSMLELSEKNVSSEVIMAMREAMRRQTSGKK